MEPRGGRSFGGERIGATPSQRPQSRRLDLRHVRRRQNLRVPGSTLSVHTTAERRVGVGTTPPDAQAWPIKRCRRTQAGFGRLLATRPTQTATATGTEGRGGACGRSGLRSAFRRREGSSRDRVAISDRIIRAGTLGLPGPRFAAPRKADLVIAVGHVQRRERRSHRCFIPAGTVRRQDRHHRRPAAGGWDRRVRRSVREATPRRRPTWSR
jgi:hypothetical protein